jgi:hypothetical protein
MRGRGDGDGRWGCRYKQDPTTSSSAATPDRKADRPLGLCMGWHCRPPGGRVAQRIARFNFYIRLTTNHAQQEHTDGVRPMHCTPNTGTNCAVVCCHHHDARLQLSTSCYSRVWRIVHDTPLDTPIGAPTRLPTPTSFPTSFPPHDPT